MNRLSSPPASTIDFNRYIRPRRVLFAMTMALLVTGLAACGGSDSSPASPEPIDNGGQNNDNDPPNPTPLVEFSAGPIDTIPVDSTSSPIADTAGVMFQLDDSSQLLLLAEVEDSDVEPAALSIIADPDLTGADMTAALGGSFFRFEAVQETGAMQAVIQTQESLAGILACNPVVNECELVLTGTLPDGGLVFDAEPDLYYAFEKVAP